MNKIIVIGAGGLGREIALLIEQINKVLPSWVIMGFLDDQAEVGSQIGNYSVLGSIDMAPTFHDAQFVFAIGSPQVKEKIYKILKDSVHFATLIHPTALIGSRVSLGLGSVVCAYCVITEDISIGQQVLLNLSCTVGHDTVIEDFCSFMPATHISGEVHVHKSVYVGTGAKIINQVEIGEGSILGAGAVVSKSIPPYCTAVGIPAKPIKFHQIDSNS
jgi:sugar O-acyltransferase (sialic acid O-acetyltransferase NeuD family)